MSWWWRTKPRSIVRTIQWFSDFGKLEGENWDKEEKNKFSSFHNNKIHPVRRTYIYNAHSTENQHINSLTYNEYLSGTKDINEAEGDGRNDKTTFEFFGFGYVDNNGIIRVTKSGRRILDGKFDDEDFLKQLLKLQFPNPVSKPRNLEDNYVFPLEIFCRCLERFGFLNRSEIALLFGCKGINHLDDAYHGIEKFRSAYNALPNKNITNDVKQIFEESFIDAYGFLDNKIETYYDYAEAFCRCLVYTGLFQTSGRSIATKIRVPSYSKTKFDLILNTFRFEKRNFNSVDEYMEWFGDSDSISLPWDTEESRKLIINEKLNIISNLKRNSDFIQRYVGDIDSLIKKINEDTNKKLETAETLSDLKDIEHELVSFITSVNEKQYIDIYAQTAEARQEILDKYDEIIETIDMGALWLEVNTWKSLLAISGEKIVKRNFNIEENLTPKSFAPGIGNTPDMEMYANDYIIIPEVSLMTGVQQWEHEASSVIDHVLSFINNNEDKKVIGLFISSSINIRTKWQFFILNRESWVEKPVPVVPMTIKQYKEIIEVFYNHNLNINQFINLIEKIKECALNSNNYNEWFVATNNFISAWKVNTVFAS